MSSPKIRRALISVSDKLGITDFAHALAAEGVEIFSTGGTRLHLDAAGVAVQDISQYTGFPELMDGRLKTLHPKIFGGILCRRDRRDDMDAMEAQGILPFELVVVNLYPFAATIAQPDVTEAQAVEQIDIGGPSLVRAAAKNYASVTIVTNAEQYSSVLEEFQRDGGTSLELRRRLMAQAFQHTAEYDRVIAAHFCNSPSTDEPLRRTTISLHSAVELRYGENPHQSAAIYTEQGVQGASLVTARQLNGKQLSYNNYLDLDSALAIARSLPEPSAVVIKHGNPCGAASNVSLAEATRKAMAGDPQSAFGSVLGFNRNVDRETAEHLATPGLFVEAMVAPGFDPDAVQILTTKPKWKNNVRLLQAGRLDEAREKLQYRHIEGGMLVQSADVEPDPESQWKVVTSTEPAGELVDQLRFGWAIVRHVKSNAITLSRDFALCGVGAGQMSRVDSVEIAIRKAGDRARGAILASDAFFPFPDAIDQAADAGIAAVIQPGGSRNDEQVIAACDKHGIAMLFTGRRHFKH